MKKTEKHGWHLVAEPQAPYLTVWAVNPENQAREKIIHYPVGGPFVSRLLRASGPREFYSAVNGIPNLLGGFGFSEIDSGFEPYLDGTYTQELLRDYPVIVAVAEA